MKKSKSVSAYTRIWLNRRKDAWTEVRESLSDRYTIKFLIDDVPSVVREGVERINKRRRMNIFYENTPEERFKSRERMRKIHQVTRFRRFVSAKGK